MHSELVIIASNRGPRSGSRTRRGLSARFHLGLTGGMLFLAALPLATAAAPNDQAKDHTLFVGQEVAVLVDGEYRPVVGAGDRSFVVDVKNRSKQVYTNQAKAVRVTRGMKLSTLSAVVADFEGSMSSDATAAAEAQSVLNSMALEAAAQDQVDYAYGHAVLEAFYAAGVSKSGATRQELADLRSAAVEAANKINGPLISTAEARSAQLASAANQRMLNTLGSSGPEEGELDILPEVIGGAAVLSASGTHITKPKIVLNTEIAESGAAAGTGTGSGTSVESRAAKSPAPSRQPIMDYGNGRSDRLDLEFKVSSPEPIDKPYVVVTTEYVAPSSAEPLRRVLAQRLDRIDSKPRKVKIYETGYPAGFHINECIVSLYANGQEIATNLSPSSMALTREEAYQYIVADYLASHKGQTRPPAAVFIAPRSVLSK
jgi:hypothetical protein